MSTTASIAMPFNPVWRLLGWLSVLFFFTTNVFAGQVTLAWDANTEPNLGGYHIVYGQASKSYTAEIDAGKQTSYTIANLEDGKTYHFAVHAYDTAKVVESANSNEVSTTIAPVAVVPSANFSADKTTGAAPLTVQFANSSTNAMTWSWNFGDGTTSTAQSPSKTYSSAGVYTVTLTATGPGGSNTATKTNYISVTAPAATAPTASFTASPASGTAPLLVTFTDTSTGTVASRTWDFGDGTTSTAQTAVKTYNTPGAFTAKLTVSNAVGSTTTSKTISATATAPVASFSASPRSGAAPLTTTFTNTSTGTITDYTWNFGDGGTLTTQTKTNPAHTYASAGTYTVSLTTKGPAGTDTETQTGYITVATVSANTGGLVAAYNFEEASGATVVDASGQGNHGAISGAARTTSGKFGRALSFDGVNDWVAVNDANSLDLTTGMTLAAWVYPTGAPSVWGTIAMKETPEDAAYGLFSDGTNDLPTAYMVGKSPVTGSTVLPVNTWTHLATTYDGSALVLYLNGNEVRRSTASGAITVSSGRLMLGGNSVWGDYFKGRIDEVRLYNRALSATEIKTDMNTAVATSSPPKRLLGEQALGSVSDSLAQGTAAAFQTTAVVTGRVTSLSVYVDSGSASTKLVAGLYADNNGRPGARLATGTLSSPKAGSWNKVLLPATPITAGTRYWVAIVSTNGLLKFRDKAGNAAQPSETSQSTTLTALPSTWATGTASGNGPLSGYGMGY